MPAITFQCGNCKNLMAVEEHLLGQQVRCPHCQQVMVASGTIPVVPSEIGPIQAEGPTELSDISGIISSVFPVSTPPHHEEESIFTNVPRATDDLFGEPVPGPVVEIPTESAPAASSPLPLPWPESTTNGPAPVASSDLLASAPEMTSSAASLPPSVPSPKAATTEPFTSSEGDWPVIDSSSPAIELPKGLAGPDVNRQVAQRAKRESLFTTYLIIILIPYAIFMTCVAAYFYIRMKQMPNPMEFLRDSGENPPAKRGTSSVLETISPETKLPPRLQVALGQVLRIGDLEVQPVKVERRKITIGSEGRNYQPESKDALVLSLRLRNVSQVVYFTPTDPVFDRQWRGEFGSNRPYMLLDIGGSRFFGGAVKWKPRASRSQFRDDDPREYVKGQEHDNQILKPGEERTSIFCTDPDNRDILKALNGYEGPLVWRVHLRRGLVQVGDREVSATAVIGVVFDKKDIINGS